MKPIEITESTLVIVEGREEEMFFPELVKHLSLVGIQVKEYGGKQKLRTFLKALVATTGFEGVGSLAIVRDADDNASDAFQSVVAAVKNAGLTAPESPKEKGDGRPTVSIMVLPDNKQPGMLEDVCLDAIQDEPAFACVSELFDCVEKRTGTLPRTMSKAMVYAFLATQEIPGRRIGEAASAGTWRFENQAFQNVREFLSSLKDAS